MKKLLAAALVFLIMAGGCARKDQLTVVLEWQRPAASCCPTCRHCDVKEADVEKACAELKAKLAAQGIAVRFVTKAGTTVSCGPRQIKLCDVPLDVWLGGSIVPDSHPACRDPEGHPIPHPKLEVGDRHVDIISADLLVKAGLSAARHLDEFGEVDLATLHATPTCTRCHAAAPADPDLPAGH